MLLFALGKIFATTCLKMLFSITSYSTCILNFTLSVSEYVTTNVTAKPFTFLHETNYGRIVSLTSAAVKPGSQTQVGSRTKSGLIK